MTFKQYKTKCITVQTIKSIVRLQKLLFKSEPTLITEKGTTTSQL